MSDADDKYIEWLQAEVEMLRAALELMVVLAEMEPKTPRHVETPIRPQNLFGVN